MMAAKERDAIHGGEEAQASPVEHTQPDHGAANVDSAAREDESSEINDQGDLAKDTTDATADDTPAAESGDDDQANSEAPEEFSLEIERLSQERDQLAAQYTRLRADFENFRRRKEEEIAGLRQSAAADVAKQLLPVLDNLERAAAATVSESDNAAEGQLLQGVNLVLRQFKQVLEQIGVEVIPSVGHPFNPEVHEAVMQVDPGDTYEPGTVVEELQRGYRMGDRILRYSMVNVAASE